MTAAVPMVVTLLAELLAEFESAPPEMDGVFVRLGGAVPDTFRVSVIVLKGEMLQLPRPTRRWSSNLQLRPRTLPMSESNLR
jgi:hypothetical protein